MDARKAERGEGRLGFIIAMAIFATVIFLAVKYIPVKVSAYQFKDFLEQETRMAAVRRNDDAVRKRILDKAIELDIPLDKKHLSIQRTAREMIISAHYEQDIDLKVTTYTYQFDHKERAPLF